ncbi:CPBP family intramembrane glutamic endopeptidase [Streptomyces sp. NPDC018059]|uniref:CPBP family intramembrane glutamic endopeptidase n=1 Tax=Streptomyces sp. NPDC018059 TaxID=3365041 RepID=UPI0037B946ED
MTISPDFSPAATALTAVLGAYLLLGEPLLGRRMYASLARRRATEPGALVRYFRVVLALWWALAALAAAALLLSPGLAAADLGIALPDKPAAVAVGVLFCAVIAVTSGRALRDLDRQGKHVPGRAAIEAMLPGTPRERALAVAFGVSDGICAEFVYRGLLIAFGVGVLGLHLYAAAALSVLVYAVAGYYQGRQGLLVFAVFGALLSGLYLATGSLLLPVALHVILSVRDLTTLTPPTPSAPPTASAAPLAAK